MSNYLQPHSSLDKYNSDGMETENTLPDSNTIDVKEEAAEDNDYDAVLESKLKVECGKVFALFGERFILVCTFCNTSFNEMQLLGEHLCKTHAQEFIKKDTDATTPAAIVGNTSAELKNGQDPPLAVDNSRESKGLSYRKQAFEKCGVVYKKNRRNAVRSNQTVRSAQNESMEAGNDDDPKRIPGLKSRIYCDTCGVSYKNRRNLVRHQKDSSCRQRKQSVGAVQSKKSKNKAFESSFLVVVDDEKHLVPNSNDKPCSNVDPLRENRINSSPDKELLIKSEAHEENHVKINLNMESLTNEPEIETCFGGTDSSEATDLGVETPENKVEVDMHACRISHQLPATHDADVHFKLFCAVCNKQFGTKKALSNHQRQHRQTVVTNVPSGDDDLADNETYVAKNPDLYCNLCDRYFRNKHSLYNHTDSHDTMPTVLQSDLDFLKCKYCCKEFPKYAERKQHESTHSGPRPYECPYCHKGFVSNLSRKSHYRIHTGESPHQCEQCLKVFRDNYDLQRHIKRHLNIRDVACERCEKKFYHKHQKELHMRTHTKERPYVCEDCGKTFVVLPQLKDHQLRHTGIKKVKCDICDRLFYSRSVLKVHMASHSDEKPFECNVCGRRFSRAKAMQKHMKLHSDVKRYVCNICGKAYAQDSGLYAHKKTHARQLK